MRRRAGCEPRTLSRTRARPRPRERFARFSPTLSRARFPRAALVFSQAAPAPRRAPSAFAGPAATNGLDADIPHLAQPPGAAPLRGAAAALDLLADARRAADDWRAAIRAQG